MGIFIITEYINGRTNALVLVSVFITIFLVMATTKKIRLSR